MYVNPHMIVHNAHVHASAKSAAAPRLGKFLSTQQRRRACRREQAQDAREAKAYEAASQAKALVRTWKKPHLPAGQSILPSELWGLVLQQLLTEDCLWDLLTTVQWLCHASTVCKGLHAAVQQHAWPQLC